MPVRSSAQPPLTATVTANLVAVQKRELCSLFSRPTISVHLAIYARPWEVRGCCSTPVAQSYMLIPSHPCCQGAPSSSCAGHLVKPSSPHSCPLGKVAQPECLHSLFYVHPPKSHSTGRQESVVTQKASVAHPQLSVPSVSYHRSLSVSEAIAFRHRPPPKDLLVVPAFRLATTIARYLLQHPPQPTA